ncbi:MAG: glycosyltransferase family 2 protein [Planctomycetota bacterium]
MSAPVTAIVMTKDEEEMLPGCLETLAWADELLVVDSGSADRTVEIARAAGARVEAHPYEGQGQQSNWAIDRASNDWIFLLDADERASEKLVGEVRALLARDGGPPRNAYRIPRRSRFLGRRIRFGGWGRDYVTRLFRRDRARYPEEAVHVDVVAEGRVGKLKGFIDHDTCRTLDEYFDKFGRYTTASAEKLFRKGRRAGLFALLVRPAFRFFRMFVLRAGLLDGRDGAVVAGLAAASVFVKYVKLRELQRRAARAVAREKIEAAADPLEPEGARG